MEHGRFRVEHRSEPIPRESLDVAFNTEGLRLSPEWDYRGEDQTINVPL